MDAEGSREVVALGEHECRVRLETRVRPPGLFRLVPGLLRRSLQRSIEADAARLRTLVELGPDAADREGGARTSPRAASRPGATAATATAGPGWTGDQDGRAVRSPDDRSGVVVIMRVAAPPSDRTGGGPTVIT